ncbi:MAG: Holliday junction resolvase RuvX [Gemmatimonadota bacterium]|jgi:putative Holliday junction resolvase
MGIDFGERRIGVALSDATGTLASPADVVTRRRGKRMPLASLERIARSRRVEQLVVGLPLDLSGRETEWCREVRAAGAALAARLDLPVAFVDERMTSVVAERAVRRPDVPRSRREEKGRVDAAAAAIILQAWLDGRGEEPSAGAARKDEAREERDA